MATRKPERWTFGGAEDGVERYSDGTTVVHRTQEVRRNGKKVGLVEIYMLKGSKKNMRVGVTFVAKTS